jgi:hypothetical protein
MPEPAATKPPVVDYASPATRVRSRKGRIERAVLIVLVLYLLTWGPAVFIIRRDRSSHAPTVYPIVPFVVLACDDERRSVYGEWSAYVAYGFGVKKLWEICYWVE